MRSFLRVAAAVALTGAACVVAAPTTANAAGFLVGNSSTCGNTVVNGQSYRCTFDDEFSGTRMDSTKWSVPTNFLSGDPSALYSCTPNDSRVESVSNGALHLSAIQVAKPVQCNSAYPATSWIAGTVSTNGHFSQTYGRFEVRMRAQAGVSGGFNEQFWLFPDPRYTVWNWPATGEIDPGQQFSWYPTWSYPAMRYGDGTQVFGTTIQECATQRGVWNTYDLIWTPTSMTFQINGVTCLVNTSADPAFTKPFFINLSEALFLANSTTQGPVTMDVDYVRVWQTM
jgi:beta-glucanase (GH16 family)